MSVRWIAVVCCFWCSAAQVQAQPALQLVESSPIETTLDHPDIPDAHEVWLEMITTARSTLDFAEFYASNNPASRLEPVVRAIEDAAQRGVRVRFLAVENFHETYPETLARLNAHDNIEMRLFDMTRLGGEFADGVLHAKYFLVDGDQAFLGSQNFDWRALEHIQELGVRIRHALLVAPLRDIFETDWQLAGGAPRSTRVEPPMDGYGLPVTVPHAGGEVKATLGFSPRGLMPQADMWDLPGIVERIDRAQNRVRVQLLSYKTVDWDSGYFDALETALRQAAARNVQVQVLLADWSQRQGTIEGLQSLQCLPNIEVRLMSIPEWSGGFIPFARVVHAKYLVVDGEYCWVGTSNWSRNYFFRSRNVGILVDGTSFGAQLDRFFETGWNSAYAETVEPGRTYVAPRRQ